MVVAARPATVAPAAPLAQPGGAAGALRAHLSFHRYRKKAGKVGGAADNWQYMDINMNGAGQNVTSAASSIRAPFSCNTDLQCQLNGRCVDGRCKCDAGWRGASCGQLTLGSSSPAMRASKAPADGGGWSWGGSPIVDGSGRWHLYYSLMVNACGLLHYQTNSVVKHAVSDDGPLGPWTAATETALSPRPGFWDSGGIHGPSVHREPGGLYILFYEATTNAQPPLECEHNASQPIVDLSATRRIGAASAESPE